MRHMVTSREQHLPTWLSSQAARPVPISHRQRLSSARSSPRNRKQSSLQVRRVSHPCLCPCLSCPSCSCNCLCSNLAWPASADSWLEGLMTACVQSLRPLLEVLSVA